MLTGKDIIIVGQQSWDTEIGSNCKDIAVELSKTNRVLYVNSPLDRNTKDKDKANPAVQKRIDVIKSGEPLIVPIKDNLYNLYPDCLVESINWIPATSIFRAINRINNKRFSKSILKAIKKLEFKSDVLINDGEMFKAFYLKEFLEPTLSVYYLRDNFMGVDYWRKHGGKLEPELIAKSDLCFTNSEYLKNYCEQYNRHSFDVGQGCDFTYFNDSDLETAPELNSIKRPIVGYVGALWTTRLDLELLENLAKKMTAVSFVYVGPEDEKFKNSVLHQMPNVHFLGSKKPEELGTFIKGFDVCINPQYLNPITIGNYPRKIDEYLALGKPTIATKTEAMSAFKEHVYLADTESDFIEGIQHLLDTDSPELHDKRKQFALSHSWENSIQKMGEKLEMIALQRRG